MAISSSSSASASAGVSGSKGEPAAHAGSLLPVVFAMVVFYWVGLYLHVPIQAPHLAGLGASGFLAGSIIGAYGLAQVLIRIPLGIRADSQFNLKRFLLIGAAMIPLSGGLRWYFANSLLGLLIANTVSGIAAAMWIVILAFVGRIFLPQALHQAMGYALTAYSVGMLVAAMGCALLSGVLSFGGLGAIEGGLGLLALVLAFVIVRKGKRIQMGHSPSREVIQQTLKNRRLWRFASFAFVQQGLVMSTVLSFAPSRAKALGASSGQVGLAVFIFWVVTVISNALVSRPWMVRLGSRVWLPLSMLLAVIYCVCLGQITSVSGLYPLQVLGGVFGGVVIPFAMSEALAEVPIETRTTALGVFQAVLAGGLVVLPPVAGALLEGLGPRGGFTLLGAIAFLTGIYAIRLTWFENGFKLKA